MAGPWFALIAVIVHGAVSVCAQNDDGLENMMAGSPCDQMQLITCFLPFMSFAMSDAALQLRPENAHGEITLPQLNQICSLSNTTAICFKGFTDRCVPKTYADIHVATSGIIKMLEMCDEPDIYPKVQKYFACAQMMQGTHDRCSSTMKSSVPQDVSVGDPMAALQRQNSLRDLCCAVKKFEGCYMPDVEGKCGADAVPVNQDFLNRLYTSFQCATHLANCPAATA